MKCPSMNDKLIGDSGTGHIKIASYRRILHLTL